MSELVDNIPWAIVIALSLTLGLAPFTPPHLFEKLAMLYRGELSRAIDWFDLAFHGAPWLLLFVKGIVTLTRP